MVSKNLRGLIGLGNKGLEYEKTYHNVGALAQAFFKTQLHERYPDAKLFFFTISSFMNTSGLPVKKFLKLHNLTPEEVVVIHDDSDQMIGSYKCVFAGGDGGHKGVQSIIETLGTNEFWRLKIGVRSPDEAVRQKAGDFVLKNISTKDQKILHEVFVRALAELEAKI